MPTWTQIEYKALFDEVEGNDVDDIEEHKAYEFSQKTFYEDDSAGVYGDDE